MSYDTALVKQIVERGGENVLDRVVYALVPDIDPTVDPNSERFEQARAIVRDLLFGMFCDGRIGCSKCGTRDPEQVCDGVMVDGRDEDSCPVVDWIYNR